MIQSIIGTSFKSTSGGGIGPFNFDITEGERYKAFDQYAF
jgi:hypothetical protein